MKNDDDICCVLDRATHQAEMIFTHKIFMMNDDECHMQGLNAFVTRCGGVRNRVFTNMDSDHKIYKEIFHQQG